MHGEATRIFYSQNTVEFNSESVDTLAFFQRLPKAALPMIRHIRHSFGEGDVLSWGGKGFFDKPDDIRWAKRFQDLTIFKENFTIPQLSIEVNMTRAHELYYNVDDDELWRLRWLFDVFMEM